jgi:cytoskeletal protein CcmA (bactofilin family)
MIRMGRSSKPEQSNDTQSFQEQTPVSPYQYQNETSSSNRAMSDSETMARDIKEGRLSGFVGYGTKLTGDTNFQAMLRIDGHLTGTVTSDNGTLIVGSSGQVDADIMVSSAMVNGTVNGDIITTERLELGRTARVMGNIQTPRLTIEDGAILEGGCTMIKAKEAVEKRKIEMISPSAAEEISSYGVEDYDEEDSIIDETEEEMTETAEAATVN